MISLRLPAVLLAALHRLAERERISLSAAIRLVISRGLGEMARDHAVAAQVARADETGPR